MKLLIVLDKGVAYAPYLKLQRLDQCGHLLCQSGAGTVMLDQHVNHPYCLLNGEAKQANATKRPVHGSPLSLYILINAQEGKAVEILGAEDSTCHVKWDG